jgi:hypothetical protein
MNPHVASLEEKKSSTKGKKPYIAPAYERLTPEQAKQLLLRRADVKDPDVMKMLQCIEDLQKQNGPGTPG